MRWCIVVHGADGPRVDPRSFSTPVDAARVTLAEYRDERTELARAENFAEAVRLARRLAR